MEPELRDFQRGMARDLRGASELYHVLDTTLIPAIVRVRASRRGLFCGQATFGRSASKTEWVYGFKMALSVSPKSVICAFGLAEAASEERPIGEFLIIEDPHDAYLADKGFTGVQWERRCSAELGKQIDKLVYDEALSVFLCCPMALVAVNRYIEFTGYAATLELAETEVTEEHWSRR